MSNVQTFDVKLYWIRHAYSCANATDNSFPFYKAKTIFLRDTLLTDTGIEQAKVANKEFKKKK